METTEKTFDAVASVRRIRDEIYQETKDMSSEERIAYFRKRSEEMETKHRAQRQDSADRS